MTVAALQMPGRNRGSHDDLLLAPAPPAPPAELAIGRSELVVINTTWVTNS